MGPKEVLISRVDAINACNDLDTTHGGYVLLKDVILALTYLEERGIEEPGVWYYDGETEIESSFRTCSHCGAVYHISSGDDAYKFCPNCGVRVRDV